MKSIISILVLSLLSLSAASAAEELFLKRGAYDNLAPGLAGVFAFDRNGLTVKHPKSCSTDKAGAIECPAWRVRAVPEKTADVLSSLYLNDDNERTRMQFSGDAVLGSVTTCLETRGALIGKNLSSCTTVTSNLCSQIRKEGSAGILKNITWQKLDKLTKECSNHFEMLKKLQGFMKDSTYQRISKNDRGYMKIQAAKENNFTAVAKQGEGEAPEFTSITDDQENPFKAAQDLMSNCAFYFDEDLEARNQKPWLRGERQLEMQNTILQGSPGGDTGTK